jgi:hypothetical protein
VYARRVGGSEAKDGAGGARPMPKRDPRGKPDNRGKRDNRGAPQAASNDRGPQRRGDGRKPAPAGRPVRGKTSANPGNQGGRPGKPAKAGPGKNKPSKGGSGSNSKKRRGR